MPHDFDPQKRSYRDTHGYISRREVKAKIDKLTDYVRKQSGRYAAKFDAGGMTAAEFHVSMRELLKAGHIVSSTVGRGGREMMAAADWGRVGAKIRWQYGYLDRFANKLATGTLTKANTANRAKQYTNAIYISYADSYQATVKEFVESGGNTNPNGELLCYLEQSSREGCEECTADAAAGPMPVSEMTPIGDRICGDFCLCEIVFEDEPEYDPNGTVN